MSDGTKQHFHLVTQKLSLDMKGNKNTFIDPIQVSGSFMTRQRFLSITLGPFELAL